MALPKSHSQSVLPNPRLLVLETIEQFEDRFLLTVRVQQVPLCPECGRASESRHSHYVRRLQDLPWQGLSVQIHLRVRRFRCRNPDCQREVFTERVEGVPPYLRRTIRLVEIVRLVGYVAGGLPGARLLARLAILTSDDTVLRRIKVPSSATLSSNPPDVLGVDDWAWRKGHTYGTILVDLEQHCVVDLLPCRSAESFEAWLKEQPRIRVISRDRSGLYAEGARLGSPAAMQVADRFHLLLNLSAAVERALEERSRQLQLPFPARGNIHGEVGRAVGEGHATGDGGPGIEHGGSDRGMVRLHGLLELPRVGVHLVRGQENFGRAAPSHHQPLRPGLFPELLNDVLDLIGQVELRLGFLDVPALQLFYVSLVKRGLHGPDAAEQALDLFQVMGFEAAGLARGLVRGGRQGVPAP